LRSTDRAASTQSASSSAGGLPQWLLFLLVALVALRVSAAVWAAVTNIRGDYYASMPGAYVRSLNPVLWESPDMQGAWGYHKDTYFHGPSQYLTLYAFAFFDSYAAIATALLPLYIAVLAIAFWVLLKALRKLTRRPIVVPLLASTFFFFPLLQAFIQREFEVIVFLCLTIALWSLLVDRRQVAGAMMAYVTWYKYAAVAFVGYLGLRRWWSALGAFVIVSLVIVGAAEAAFGLRLFFNNNVPGHASQVFNLWSNEFRIEEGGLVGAGFCSGWWEKETTLANVRHGLCSVSASVGWLPPHVTYLVICTAIAAAYLRTHVRLARTSRDWIDEQWRRALELSIVIATYTCFLFNHYYYLIVLAIPFGVLLVRYLDRDDWGRLAAWVVAYALVSAFVVPMSMLTRLAGRDVWELYITGAWFMYGELLLMALLLLEYWALGRQRSLLKV
jgi:glycosyl transferase family 87